MRQRPHSALLGFVSRGQSTSVYRLLLALPFGVPTLALLRLLEQVRPRGRGSPFSSLPWSWRHEELKVDG